MRKGLPCAKHKLAQSDNASVDRCDCGTVTLHIGGVSVRIPETHLAEVVRTFGLGLMRVSDMQNRRGSRLSVVPWAQS